MDESSSSSRTLAGYNNSCVYVYAHTRTHTHRRIKQSNRSLFGQATPQEELCILTTKTTKKQYHQNGNSTNSPHGKQPSVAGGQRIKQTFLPISEATAAMQEQSPCFGSNCTLANFHHHQPSSQTASQHCERQQAVGRPASQPAMDDYGNIISLLALCFFPRTHILLSCCCCCCCCCIVPISDSA